MSKVIYFLAPHEPMFGVLSNWSSHGITDNGLWHVTMEHYFMYKKAMLMGDISTARQILLVRTPREAKQLGRQVTNWNEARWVAEREGIVLHGLYLKASQHPDVARTLHSSGTAILAEANRYDRIWGIGCGPNEKSPETWPGLNLLGKLWMQVRDSLG